MDTVSVRVWRALTKRQVFIYERDSRRTLLCTVTGHEAEQIVDRFELLPLGYRDTTAEVDENGQMYLLSS